jgi:glycerophosphoryl diester phosphodiesterase
MTIRTTVFPGGIPQVSIDASTGNETYQLPAGYAAGRRLLVRRVDSGATYTVTVTVPTGGSIDGVTDGTLTVGADLEVTFEAGDGNAWQSTGSGRALAASLAASSAFTGTYAQLMKLSGFARPYTVAHNGSSNILPIHTIQGYEYAFNAGFPILDLDAQLLADGSLANMHNTAVDNYASVTGNVNTFTVFDFKALTVNPSSWLAPGYPNYSPALIADVLGRFGPRACYAIEAKDATTSTVQKIVNLVTALGLKSQVIIQSVALGSLAPAVSAGIAAMHVTNTPDVAALAAAGVTGICILYSTSSATISAAVTAGLTVWAWGVQRRYDHAAMAALGVQGVVSDDPLYTSTTTALMTKDTFTRQTWAPGHVLDAASRGTLISGGKLQYGVGQNASTLLGWLSPVANAASTYTITWTWTYDAIGGSASAYPFIHVAAPDDRVFPNNIGSAGYGDGYRVQLQQNGSFQIQKTDRAAGTSTNIASVAATAPTDGSSVTLTLTVTPTTVSASIPAQSKTITANDTSFRGGYVHCGQNGVGGAMQTSLSAVTVS